MIQRHSFTSVVTLALLLPLVWGRTGTFPSTSSSISYSSQWTQVSDDSANNGIGESTSVRGETLSFEFDGEQVTVQGTADGAYTVSLDGTTTESVSSTDATIFKVDGLSRTVTHQLSITLDEDAEMVVSQVRVAYLTSTDLIPSLVDSADLPTSSVTSTTTSRPTSSFVPTSAFVTNFLSSSSPTSSSSASSSSPAIGSPLNTASTSNDDTASHHLSSAKGGAIAGGVIGGAIAIACLIYLAYLSMVRRRNRRDTGYWDTRTGLPRRGGFVVGGVPVDSSKFLSQTAGNNGNTEYQRHLGQRDRDAGGVDASPPNARHQREWRGRMRTPSWTRNLDRLSVTRAFYRVAVPPVASDIAHSPIPPPTEPLPPLPNSSGAVVAMSEANPLRIPVSQSRHASTNLSSSSVPPTSSTSFGIKPLITRPLALNSRPRFSVAPPAASYQPRAPADLPTTYRPLPSASSPPTHLRRRTSSIDQSKPLPIPRSPGSRNSRDQLSYQIAIVSASASVAAQAKKTMKDKPAKTHRPSPSYTSQDEYYTNYAVFDATEETLPASTVETLVAAGEIDPIPTFWHSRNEIPRYAGGEKDPRNKITPSTSQSTISTSMTSGTSRSDEHSFAGAESEDEQWDLLHV